MTTFNVQQDHVNSFYGGKQLYIVMFWNIIYIVCKDKQAILNDIITVCELTKASSTSVVLFMLKLP